MNSALDACAMIAYLRAEPGFAVVASLLADPAGSIAPQMCAELFPASYLVL
jgi:hypothetical protein